MRVKTLDIIALTDGAANIRALLFTSPESLPADRIAITVRAAEGSGAANTQAIGVKLIGADVQAGGQGYVDLMTLEEMDPVGTTVLVQLGLLQQPRTQPLYTFPSQGTWPSGTVFRLTAGADPQRPADWQT